MGHIHMHLDYHPSQNISALIKKLIGRELKELTTGISKVEKKRCWGRHYCTIGFGC